MLAKREAELTEVQLTPIEDLEGSLAQRVYLSLQEAILKLHYPPGTILRKGKICEQLKVSRSPVAEAIARLSADCLVDVIPQSATRVSEFSMDNLREACFLREALELAVIAKIAENRTADQLMQLTREVRMQFLMIEDGDLEGFYHSDEAFHNLLMNFTGFPSVVSMASMIELRLDRARMLILPEEGRAMSSAQEHQQILEAIQKQDPKLAQKRMKEHLEHVLIHFVSLASTHPTYFKTK